MSTYLSGMADRLSGEIRRTLKDAGVLGDDSGQASAKSAAHRFMTNWAVTRSMDDFGSAANGLRDKGDKGN